MQVNVVLDIGLGLVFMYLLLSLICTALSEMAAAALSLRAKTLKSGLEKMLTTPDGQALYRDVMGHPLIKSAYAMAGRHGPSYLSAHTFTVALLDRIAPGLPADPNQLMAHIREGLASVKDPTVKGILDALAKGAQGDIDKLKEGVATWFDDAMDRLSGTYKRKTQAALFALGVLVSGLFNADTLSVATTLWRDSALRAEIAREAIAITDEDLVADYVKARDALRQFPIGWQEGSAPTTLWGWLVKLCGVLVTGLAVALGAPFWFDMLKRVNAIRTAGPKPRRGMPATSDSEKR